MDNTIIQQGRFVATGGDEIIAVRSDIDYFLVRNDTQWLGLETPGRGFKFEWQRGLDAGNAWILFKGDASTSVQSAKVLTGGFTLIDSSDQFPEAEKTGTIITKGAPALCTLTAHGYSTGDIIRIFSSDTMDQINGLEFSVTKQSDNTFDLTNMDTNTANFTAATSFKARRIPFDPQFFPTNRVITRISVASSAIVTLAVNHGFTVGQEIRLQVSDDFGMTEINDLTGSITAINEADVNGFTNTITLNIDSSTFTAFAWPSSVASPLTFAQAIPIGESATESLGNTFGGATDNQSIIGMRLGAGILRPAGSAGDVIYWQAGKVFSVTNN